MSSITHKLYESFDHKNISSPETAAAVEGFKRVLCDMIENHKVGGFHDKNLPWSYGLAARMCRKTGWYVVETIADGLASAQLSDVDYNPAPHKRLDITNRSANATALIADKIMGNVIAAKNLALPSEWYMVAEYEFEALQERNSHRKWVWSSWHHDLVWRQIPTQVMYVSMKRMRDLLNTTPAKKRKRKKVLARPVVLQAQLFPDPRCGHHRLSPWFDLVSWHQGCEDYDVVKDMMELQADMPEEIIRSHMDGPLIKGLATSHWSKKSWCHYELYRMLRENYEVGKNITVFRSLFNTDPEVTGGTKKYAPSYNLRLIKRPAVSGRTVDNLSDDFSGEPQDHNLEIKETEYDYGGDYKRKRARPKARRRKRLV